MKRIITAIASIFLLTGWAGAYPTAKGGNYPTSGGQYGAKQLYVGDKVRSKPNCPAFTDLGTAREILRAENSDSDRRALIEKFVYANRITICKTSKYGAINNIVALDTPGGVRHCVMVWVKDGQSMWFMAEDLAKR